MSARSRDSVARSASSESQLTYSRFMAMFPDNDACLEYLKGRSYPDGTECPKCGKATKFHRIRGRAAYSCQFCGRQVYPTAGTIFEKSTTSLQLWFWAIFLMSSTRCGISAKQLEREIGVTYKTAHRMFKQIRTLLTDEGDGPLSGQVEVDETYVGGKPRGRGTRGRPGKLSKKVPVLAMVERRGRLVAKVMPDARKATIMPHIKEYVLPASMIYTDEVQGLRRSGPQRLDPSTDSPPQAHLRGRRRNDEHGGGVFRTGEERPPWRLSLSLDQVPADLLGRVHVPLQPARLGYSAFLGDLGSRPEASRSRSLAPRSEARSRSRRKSRSVWSTSIRSTTSSLGGVGSSFCGRCLAGIESSAVDDSLSGSRTGWSYRESNPAGKGLSLTGGGFSGIDADSSLSAGLLAVSSPESAVFEADGFLGRSNSPYLFRRDTSENEERPRRSGAVRC